MSLLHHDDDDPKSIPMEDLTTGKSSVGILGDDDNDDDDNDVDDNDDDDNDESSLKFGQNCKIWFK